MRAGKFLHIMYGVVGLLIIWKLLLFLVLPYPNADGPWSLSQVLSFVRGDLFESTFAHSYMTIFNLPWGFTLLNAPFYLFNLFGGYQIFIVNILLIGVALLLISILFQRLKTSDNSLRIFLLFITCITVLTSTYFYSLRAELPCFILLILLLLHLVRTEYSLDKWKLVQYGFAIAFIGTTHPVAGVFGYMFMILILTDSREGLSSYLWFSICVLSWVLVLYGPVVFMNFDEWVLNFFQRHYEGDYRSFRLSSLVKFFIFTPAFAVLVVNGLLLFGRRKIIYYNLILFSVFSLVLAFFSRSYYFQYLIVLVLYRLFRDAEELLPLRISVVSLSLTISLCAPLMTHYFPSYQLVENRDYANKWREILIKVESVLNQNPNVKVWMPPSLGGVGVFYPNARMHFVYYDHLTGEAPPFGESDIILAESPSTINYLKGFINGSKYSIDQIVEPTTGLVRLPDLDQRSESVGLWRIRLEPH